MANTNQATRAGNVFGRMADAGYNDDYGKDVALKPGYIIKLRDRFHLVESVEALTVDLYFSDNHSVTVSSSQITDVDMIRYGQNSMTAALFPGGSPSTSTVAATILRPDFDSDYMRFDDLEPFFGHLYCLCPTLPGQPKFMDAVSGDWLVSSGVTDPGQPPSSTAAAASRHPIGFDVSAGGAGLNHVKMGFVSPKLYLRHPSGVPKWVLDEAPEAESGSASTTTLLGVNGFIDHSISPPHAPNWNYSIWLEHGENNLPQFRLVNDCEEFILDGRIRLQGWKYKIAELSMDQMSDIKRRSGGRLTFKIINPAGIPTAGSLLSEYFPK